MLHQQKPELPLVMVLSGPSGVGKDATIDALRKAGLDFHFVTTATTRQKRENERDGVDYFFMTVDEFTEGIANDEFIEYAQVYGNYYGVLRKEISSALHKGQDVILRVDIQGAATLKKRIPAAVFIFLLPPSLEDLISRLSGRNTNSESDRDIRIKKAQEEMQRISEFDYAVVNHNDDLASTANKVMAILSAEKSKVYRRQIKIT